MEKAIEWSDWTGTARRALSAVLVAGMLAAGTIGPAAAAAECGKLPRAPWWSLNTYEAVIQHVNRDLSGDWHRYLSEWNRYAARMKATYARGGTAVVRSIGKKLRGPELKRHIVRIETKLAVLTCLAKREHEAAVAARLNLLATSAKSPAGRGLVNGRAADDHLGRSRFSVDSPGRRLEITTVCRGANAVFTVRNVEKRASEVGRFTVLGGDRETVLTSRRLRLTAGESIRFSIPVARLDPFGGRAVFRVAMVEANPTVFDADLACI